MKSAQTAKVGKKFKTARLSLGLTETDVSAKTFINPSYIKAIEGGDYSIFPARMFAFKYFEKYSLFLEIQPVFYDIYNINNASEIDGNNTKISLTKVSTPTFIITGIFLLLMISFITIFSVDNLVKGNTIFKKESSKEQFLITSKKDIESIENALLSAKLLMHPMIKDSGNSKLYKFEISQGVINNLSIEFTQDSWIEIYQGNNQLIYKLFQADDNLEIALTPPFKIVTNKPDGLSGFYDENTINFTQLNNQLNVRSIEIDNE
jgi:cytoskeletal protein RodZ